MSVVVVVGVVVVIQSTPLPLLQADGDDSDFTYKLFSVIIHKGGCYGGHYHAFIRDIDQLGHWEPPVRSLVQIIVFWLDWIG